MFLRRPLLIATIAYMAAIFALCGGGADASTLLPNHPAALFTAPASAVADDGPFTLLVTPGETLILAVRDGRACTAGMPGFDVFTTASPPVYVGRSTCDPDGLSSSYTGSFTTSLIVNIFNSTPFAITAGTIGYGLAPMILTVNGGPLTFVVPAYTPNTLSPTATAEPNLVLAASGAATSASALATNANTWALMVYDPTGPAGMVVDLLTAVTTANNMTSGYSGSVIAASTLSLATTTAARDAALAATAATADALTLAAQTAAAAANTVLFPTLANAILTQSLAYGTLSALDAAVAAQLISSSSASAATVAVSSALTTCEASTSGGCGYTVCNESALDTALTAAAALLGDYATSITNATNRIATAQASALLSVTAANAALIVAGPIAPNALGLVTASQAAVGAVFGGDGSAAPATAAAALLVYSPGTCVIPTGPTSASGTAVTCVTSATALNAAATAPPNVLFSTAFKAAALDAQDLAIYAQNAAAIATSDAQAAVLVAAAAKAAADSSVFFVADTPIYKSALAYEAMRNAQDALLVAAASALASYNAALAAEAAAVAALAACNADTLQCALSASSLAAATTAIIDAGFNVAAAANVLALANTAATLGAAATLSTQTTAEILAITPAGVSATILLTTSTIPRRYAAVTITAPCIRATDGYIIHAADTIGLLECAVAGQPAVFTYFTTTTGLTTYYVISDEFTLVDTTLTIIATYDTIPIEDNGRPTVIPAIPAGDASATYSFDMAAGETAFMSITMGTGCSPALTAFNVYNFSTFLGSSSCFTFKSMDAINAGQYLFQTNLSSPGTANIVVTNELVEATLGSGSITLS